MSRQARSRIASILAATALAAAALALGSGCDGLSFRELMEGKDGAAREGKLALSPATATLAAGGSLVFAASGGDGYYSFAVAGDGTFDAATLTYAAPAWAGTERLRVTDGTGAIAEALITVKAALMPDYRVSANPAAAFPATGLDGGGAFAGSFSIENLADEPGSGQVSWTVYLSRDAALDGLDPVVDQGAIAALDASSVSANVPFEGTWPVAGGVYYLILSLSAGDEVEVSNNLSVSGAITVSGAARPSYSLASVTVATPAGAGKPLSGTFSVSNSGGAGASDLLWTVHLSADASLDSGDIEVDSGSLAAGLPSGLAAVVSEDIAFSGSHPLDLGTWYYIAKVEAFDDDGAGTRVLSSPAVVVTGPSYSMTALSSPGSGAAGRALSGSLSLSIANIGPGDGSKPIEWEVYASLGDAGYGGGDVLLDSGTAAALAVGVSTNVSYDGAWPLAAGTYYLVARAKAADAATAATRASGAITVYGPDYGVAAVALPSGNVAGRAMSGSFTIANSGLARGAQDVAWKVYASTDAAFDAGDALVASGTTPALGAGASVVIDYSGTWPAAAGTCYLIARAQAPDDDAIGERASTPVALGAYAVDYALNSVSLASGGMSPGGAANGSFLYSNEGPTDGSSALSWEVYASPNQRIDAGSVLMASGAGLAGLAAGTFGEASWAGTWPLAYGDWYLVAVLSCAEDDDGSNDSGASSRLFTVGRYVDTEPNDAVASAQDLAVSLRSGTSFIIEGSLKSGDLADFFAFNTGDGTATSIRVELSWTGNAASAAVGISDGVGALGDVNGPSPLVLPWTVDAANAGRYLELNLPAGGNALYSCLVTAE